MQDLLAALRARGEVSLVQGRLRVRAHQSALTPQLRAEVSTHKPELIAALEAEAAGQVDRGHVIIAASPEGGGGSQAVLDAVAAEHLVADGRDILAALSERGITVRLADGDQPLVGPADQVDEADRALLAAHRDAVLAALNAGPAPVQTAPPTCPWCRQQNYMPLGSGWRRCWSCGRRWGSASTEDPGDPSDLDRIAALLGLADPPRWTSSPRAGEKLASSSPEAAIDEAASDYPAGVLCQRDGCRGLGWSRDPESGGWRCRACGGPLEGAATTSGTAHGSVPAEVSPVGPAHEVFGGAEPMATPTTPEPIGVLCRRQGCGSLRWRWDAVVGDWRCRRCGGPLPPWLLKAGA